MGDLSEHFSRAEFECSCGCGFDTVDVELIDMLESVRSKFRAPIRINSGCRCPEYNAEIGGVAKSQHVKGRAADIVVSGIPSSMVQGFVKSSFPNASIGSYSSFTHIDSRSGQPKWWNG